ncbi:CsbD family protein [Mycobacterium sp.]|uniref:CsbD family protein n=1 Tax=Mycobacterium sp. TaxID=1785 RepID=UPI003F7E4CDC
MSEQHGGFGRSAWIRPKKGYLVHYLEKKDTLMSGADKARNKAEQLSGKVKEAIGRAINDHALHAEGKDDQRAAHLKDAGEKIKDAFRPRRHRQT